MAHTRIFVSGFLLLAGCYGDVRPQSDENADELPPECQLQTEGEKTPGYPFNLNQYQTEVLPAVVSSCATAGCHGAPANAGNFTLWGDAQPGDCNYAKTFNAIAGATNLARPADGSLLIAISGAHPTHPVSYGASDEPLLTIANWTEDASLRFLADGGGGNTPPPGASPFDYATFQTEIQPLFDSANPVGCAAPGCHGDGAGGLTLFASPSPDSSEMEANFLAITSRSILDTPESSDIYLKSVNAHASGTSSTIALADAELLLTWIRDAANRGEGVGDCAPITSFNLGVFQDEIMPILEGQLDLNQPGQAVAGTGCTAGPCHSMQRGPGTLFLDPNDTAENNLKQFSCFVDLIAPTRSEALACPLNQPGCRQFPHPGQEVFSGVENRNYQRLLSYIYSASSQNKPFDFAFFTRKVNPIFSDLNAVQDGAQGRTCADTAGCHGVNAATQNAPNGSNFPILPNATDPGRIGYNFVAATSFADFLSPDQSSLFLYPTNEIQALTGLPHPGGADFEVDSEEALNILKWVAGLRPDADGFLRDWLIAGDFPAALVGDITAVDEVNVLPKIFDVAGGAFAGGQWDGLFADNRDIDFDDVFPRAVRGNRAAYALVYLTNTLPVTRTVEVRITTENALRAYVNQQVAAQSTLGGTSTVIANLPPAGSAPTRILIKLLEQDNDNDFAFTAQLADDRGVPIVEQSGEILITLSPNGGI